MEEKKGKRISRKVNGKKIDFSQTDDAAVTSPVKNEAVFDEPPVPALLSVQGTASEVKLDEKEYSPEFLALATPTLPNLSKSGNRARLLMQSPNKLYFYWAVAKNPFHTLNRALGEPGSYTLVLKLVDQNTGREQLHPVDASGNWWFDVDADSEYRAEIGFYAVNRPYIRVLYSNTVATPRKSPSPRTADTAEWRIPAEKFARVLDVAGFARDAFDVALAGDDWDAADISTRSAFAQFSGRTHAEFTGIGSDEIRYAMLALASGVSLEQLRGLISERLFVLLSGMAEASGEQALAALKDKFEFDADEFDIEELEPETVVGASLVNFPRKLRKRRSALPDVGPIGSHTLLR